MAAENQLWRRLPRTPNRRGFTAIELIIVVVIIGVLAAAGMNKYKNFTITARKNACVSNQEQITAAIRLVENDSGSLASSTVLRLHVDGTIDNYDYITHTASTSNQGVWLGTIPPSWGKTDTSNPLFTTSPNPGGNTEVLKKAQEMRLFRCPEDSNNQDPGYTYCSSLLPGSTTGAYTASTDPCTFTFAKTVASSYTRAASFTPAIPNTTADPLEGFNWLKNPIEWQNSSVTFCRRWGLRDSKATGYSPAGLNGVATDVNYIPGRQETKLAHSSFAPIN